MAASCVTPVAPSWITDPGRQRDELRAFRESHPDLPGEETLDDMERQLLAALVAQAAPGEVR